MLIDILRMFPGINRLPIADVEQYLQSHGWKKATSVNPNAIAYEGPLNVNGEPILVVLPAHKSLIDADRRLNDVIRTVAAIESKVPERLVEEIAKSRMRRRLIPRKTYSRIVQPRTQKAKVAEDCEASLGSRSVES